MTRLARKCGAWQLLLLTVCTFSQPAFAGGTSTAIRDAAEIVAKKVLGKSAQDAAEQGAEKAGRGIVEGAGAAMLRNEAETIVPRIERLVAAHGEEAIPFVKRTGMEGMEALEKAGPRGGDVLKLFAKSGDEAAWVVAKPGRTAIFLKHGEAAADAMFRHGEVAESMIQQFEAPAARALSSVEGQSARRLAMMAEDGSLRKIGRSSELLETVGKYGDGAMNFIWRNKGALTVAAALTAFLADPKPFIEGTKDIAKSGIENVAAPAARSVHWTPVVLTVIIIATLLLLAKFRRTWFRSQQSPTIGAS
jgi:hypothetical protein